MTSAPASSAPPSVPDAALPQSSGGSNSYYANSPQNGAGQPSSFATMLHQANDNANESEDPSSRDAQDQNKNAKQAAVTAPTPTLVAEVQQPIATSLGFPAWTSTTAKTEKSAGPVENETPATDAALKKADATANTTGATFLLHAIAGLGIPQLVPPSSGQALAGQRSDNREKTGHRDEVHANAAVAAAGPVSGDTNSSLSVSTSVSTNSDTPQKGGNTGIPIPAAPPEGDGKALQSSGQLAFAARLNADAASSQTPSSSQAAMNRLYDAPATAQSSTATDSDAVQPSAAVTQAVQNGPGQAEEHAQKSEGEALPASTAAAEPVAATRADAAHALDQPADVRSADVDPTPAASANATAVRDVQIQVTGSDNQRVDVRVMDRGGELRVSVRADDPSLVRSLQDNVADLSTRLDQAHFRSEVWTPRTQAISQTDSASTNGRTFSNGGETSGRDGQGQQQNGRQQQQPSWMDDFEENPTGRNSGGTTPWHR